MTNAPQKHPTEGLRWQGEMGERWNAHHERFESMLADVGAALIDAAAFRQGERVLDIGCGAGATTFEIARRVGSTGRVTGLDISPLLVDTAARRAQTAGLTNVDFIAADATTAVPTAPCDCLFSRFGVMFFEDPYAAFANLRRFLKPGGRLVFSCWGPMADNPWVQEAMGVVARYKELPKPVPRAPSPFAFAETDYVRDILGKAGFRDTAFATWRGGQRVGGAGADAAQAARFLMEAASVGDALTGEPQEMKDKVYVDLVDLFGKYDGPGGVSVPSMAWLVSARA